MKEKLRMEKLKPMYDNDMEHNRNEWPIKWSRVEGIIVNLFRW
jgi:hypothetical protein